jgi:hypothetical protein
MRSPQWCKENDEWNKEGSLNLLQKDINEVTRRTLQTLVKEKEINAEEYKDMDSQFSLSKWMKCLVIQRIVFPLVMTK